MSEWTPEMEANLLYYAIRGQDRPQRGPARKVLEGALAEIRRLRDVAQNAVDTLHDHGALKRIEGARAMRECACHALVLHLAELGWAAEQRQAIETVYKTIRALNPEDV